jgi:hypothetical protein
MDCYRQKPIECFNGTVCLPLLEKCSEWRIVECCGVEYRTVRVLLFDKRQSRNSVHLTESNLEALGSDGFKLISLLRTVSTGPRALCPRPRMIRSGDAVDGDPIRVYALQMG